MLRAQQHAATVTDAALVLGLLDPDYFLGGRLRLETGLSSAIESAVAKPLHIGVEAAAEAVITVFSEKTGVHQRDDDQPVLDPRRCLLVAGGGASGLNMVAVARELGVPRVLVPTAAAGLTAVGGHYADMVATASAALRTTTRDFDHEGVNAALATIARELAEFVVHVGIRVRRRRRTHAT